MEILFRQRKSAESRTFSLLEAYGIEGCVFKQLSFARDRARITKKSHYHTSIEIHMIERGYQLYEIAGRCVRVNAGEFLLIPPLFPHMPREEAPDTEKHAFTLRVRDSSPFAPLPTYKTGALPDDFSQAVCTVTAERKEQLPFHTAVIEARVWEILLRVFRAAALLRDIPQASADEENERILLVKQYVDDNLHRGVSLSELASYACIGEKQLERLFRQHVGMTVMGYVRKKRCQAIEALLADPSLSLREISERMHFGSEYHFSAYFKKYAGMPPGAYRKAMMK